MLLPLLELFLLSLIVYAITRLTLRHLHRVGHDLQRLGHPLTFWNWLNLPALRLEHRSRQQDSSRSFLESMASVACAREVIQAEIQREMAGGLSFEQAARVVLKEAHER